MNEEGRMKHESRPETVSLETVSIERPCPKRWSELVGDDTRRFCSECRLHVTNLSALTRAEGETFLADQGGGRVCVTYVPDASGGVRSRATRRPRGVLARLASLAAACLGVLVFLPGCRPADVQPEDGGPQDPGGTDEDQITGRIVGKVRADPQCVVDDDRMIMGEMVAPDVDQPEVPGDSGADPDVSR
jgi:hypothetical protein